MDVMYLVDGSGFGVNGINLKFGWEIELAWLSQEADSEMARSIQEGY